MEGAGSELTSGRDMAASQTVPGSATQMPHNTSAEPSSSTRPLISHRARLSAMRSRALAPISRLHRQIPYVRALPFPALLIILVLVLVNLLVWAICALIILIHHPRLISTAAIAYTLGLRHALDADHISAIDLMTRRLIASGQRPVTVGTFFSLGHSTIVIITSIVVAATAAGVSKKFDGISTIGSIIGSAVSASFLILLGLMNGYILYRLVVQLHKILHMHPAQSQAEVWKIEGGGVLFRILKKLFKVTDKPWKMYPLGVLFGLGFDTSSEVALLGISSIQGAKGTSIWLILVFPILFTVGMCLVDTIDGALMLALYTKPMDLYGETKKEEILLEEGEIEVDGAENANDDPSVELVAPNDRNPDSEERIAPPARQELRTDVDRANQRAKDPIAFLYYSIVLTCLTIVVALVIGTIQLLTLVLNVAYPNGAPDGFWNGVAVAGDDYEIIGGGICGSFIVVGLASVLAYKPWRRWSEAKREREFAGVPAPDEVTRDDGVLVNLDSDGGEEGLVNRKDGRVRIGAIE